MRRLRFFYVAVALLTACGDSVTGLPFYGPPLPRAASGLANVNVTLSASATAVSPGDSVVFSVTATNRSAVRVQLGEQCGPMMDVAVRAPTSAGRYEARGALRRLDGLSNESTALVIIVR